MVYQSIIDRMLGSTMSVPDRDADENGLYPELYLGISWLFSGEMLSPVEWFDE